MLLFVTFILSVIKRLMILVALVENGRTQKTSYSDTLHLVAIRYTVICHGSMASCLIFAF